VSVTYICLMGVLVQENVQSIGLVYVTHIADQQRWLHQLQ